MASLHQPAPGANYRIRFRLGGKQYYRSLDTSDARQAQTAKATIEETLRDLERGKVELPDVVDLWEFLRTGGKRATKLQTERLSLTLQELFERHAESIPPGTNEQRSLDTRSLHQQHIARILGKDVPAASIALGDVQRYINRRRGEKSRNGPIGSRTIKKEVSTFTTAWRWARSAGHVAGDIDSRRLKYPKEPAPVEFLPMKEVERRIAACGSPKLWRGVFLDRSELDEFLAHIATVEGLQPWVVPALTLVACTGCRRSEMMRSESQDFDFETKEVLIREKKKDTSVEFTPRWVPMSTRLYEVMQGWLASRPGGQFTFSIGGTVARSPKRSATTGHLNAHSRPSSYKERMASVRVREDIPAPTKLTEKVADDAWDAATRGSRWAKLPGYHVLRHSYGSILAAAGGDMGKIMRFMGHLKPEMSRHYTHITLGQRKALQEFINSAIP